MLRWIGYTTAEEQLMRTNIDIDDKLMADAISMRGLKTKKAVVEEALRMLIRHEELQDSSALRGKVESWPGWEEERLKEHGVDYSSCRHGVDRLFQWSAEFDGGRSGPWHPRGLSGGW